MSGIQIVTTPSSSNDDKTNVIATCPAGKTIMGGGADTSNPDAGVINSAARRGDRRQGHHLGGRARERNSITPSWTLTVHVICATG